MGEDEKGVVQCKVDGEEMARELAEQLERKRKEMEDRKRKISGP